MKRYWIAAITMTLLMLLSSPVIACSTPVFRYAMERWQADYYDGVVIYKDEIPDDHPTAVLFQGEEAEFLNIRLSKIGLDDEDSWKHLAQKPEDSNSSGVEKEDRTWIALAQLASELHNAVIVPTQVTKAALDAQTIKEKHTARWVGKLGHVDAMYAMSRTEREIADGVMRFSCIDHRHRKFDPNEEVLVLQTFDAGVVMLDSARGA